MPIKPRPFVISCTACHWSKLYASRSDVLLQLPVRCPRCHATLRQTKASGALVSAFLAFTHLFSRSKPKQKR